MYANRFFSLLVIMALAMVITLTVQEVVATKAVVLNGQPQAAQRHRGLDADMARWTAMGEYYENLEEAKLLRSRNADTARWTAMGEYYQSVKEARNISPDQAADAARWAAMSEYYQKLAAVETRNLQRGRAADAARWTAMAEYYAQIRDATR